MTRRIHFWCDSCGCEVAMPAFTMTTREGKIVDVCSIECRDEYLKILRRVEAQDAEIATERTRLL